MLTNNSNLILLLISIVIVILTVVIYLEFKKIKIEMNELKKDIEVLKYNLMKIMNPSNLQNTVNNETHIVSSLNNKSNKNNFDKVKKDKSIKKTINTIVEKNIDEPTKIEKKIEKNTNTDIDKIVESIIDFDIKDINNNIDVIIGPTIVCPKTDKNLKVSLIYKVYAPTQFILNRLTPISYFFCNSTISFY